MILINLKMVDFRQYYGESEIRFAVSNPSDSNPRNITLVHGENGVGKTTLMNAITWCLYQHLGDDFEGRRELVNEIAFKEGKRGCRVEVTFKLVSSDEVDERIYTAIRYYDQPSGDEKKLKLFVVDRHGNHQEMASPRSFINSIVPKEMCRYFFFHGEGLINIQTSEAGSEAFRNAVRAILGCTFVEQAIKDLGFIKSKLSKEIAQISSKSQSHARFKLELETALREKDDYSVKRDEWQLELSKAEQEMQAVDERLSKSNVNLAREIQNNLSILRRTRDQNIIRKKAGYEKQVSLIENYGWKVFGTKLAVQSQAFMEEASHKGKIPAPFDRPFVETILEQASCVCGRPITPGSKEEAAIRGLIETANDGNVHQKKIRAGSIADRMTLDSVDFPQLVIDCEQEIREIELAIRENEEDIEQYDARLKAIDDKEIASLQARRKAAFDRAKTCEGGRRVCVDNLERVDRTILEINRQLREALPNTPQAAILGNMATYVDILETRCNHLLKQMEEKSRSVLAHEVNDILKRYSTQDYRIGIDNNYGFQLVRADGSVVKKSKGEKLLLNLAFVSALIKHARLRSKASGEIFIPGATAPFVIDAPFGELDQAYRAATARFLPSSSEQLVLLLSSSHWTPDIDAEIREKIGAEYILVSHKDIQRDDKPSTPLKINGKRYEQARYGAERRMTTIKEIE